MFEHEDRAEVRRWLQSLGFRETEDGWMDELGYIASITWSATSQKWHGAHTIPESHAG